MRRAFISVNSSNPPMPCLSAVSSSRYVTRSSRAENRRQFFSACVLRLSQMLHPPGRGEPRSLVVAGHADTGGTGKSFPR